MAFLLPRHPHIGNYPHSPHSFSVHLLNCYFLDFPACHIAEKFMKCSCFLKRKMNDSTNSYLDKILQIKEKIGEADAIIIGAGAGLSTSAGFVYNGERFEKYFSDFRKKYGFSDMYSGGFYPYKTLEKHWGYWCRYIYINRYMDAPRPVYQNLYDLVKEKDYFVLTTNVDHCFQKAGFAKNRIFYTQGDYGLFQCSEPCHKETYDNEDAIKKMVLSQGFQIKDGELQKPEDGEIKLMVPTGLIPYCPRCGKPMSMNLRSDQTFVEDEATSSIDTRTEALVQKGIWMNRKKVSDKGY